MVMGPTGALACSEYGTWSCTDSPCGGRGPGSWGAPTVHHRPRPEHPDNTFLKGLKRRVTSESQQVGEAWGSSSGRAAPCMTVHKPRLSRAPSPRLCSGHCDPVQFKVVPAAWSQADTSRPPCAAQGDRSGGAKGQTEAGRCQTLCVRPIRASTSQRETKAPRGCHLPKSHGLVVQLMLLTTSWSDLQGPE